MLWSETLALNLPIKAMALRRVKGRDLCANDRLSPHERQQHKTAPLLSVLGVSRQGQSYLAGPDIHVELQGGKALCGGWGFRSTEEGDPCSHR